MSNYGPPPSSPPGGPGGPGDPTGPGGPGGPSGPGGQAPPPPPPPGPYPSGGPSPSSSTGFFGALFDFSFSSFITPKLVKVVYAVSVVLIAIYYLGIVIVGFSSDEPALGIVALILGAVGALIVLAFWRMTLEFYLAIVRMSEDVHQRLPRG